MQPHEYVELIKFALRLESGKSHPSIKICEQVTERTTEDWSISPGNKLLTHVYCGNEKFLKKLVKILKEADIAHEVDRPDSLTLLVFGWSISKPTKSIT